MMSVWWVERRSVYDECMVGGGGVCMMSVWWVECLHKCIRCRWITQQVSHQQLMTSALLIRGHLQDQGGRLSGLLGEGNRSE